MKKHIWLILLGALGLHNVTYAIKKTINPVDGSIMYECDMCPRKFIRENLCTHHEKTHSNPNKFACNQDGCGKCFAEKRNLMDHLQKHGINLFTCDICTKVFKKSNDFNYHKSRHTNKTPFFCETCHLSLNTQAGLTYHKNHTDHSKIFDRRSVGEPSAADTLTQPHETALGLSDTDLAGLVELVTNSEKPGDFFLTDLSIHFNTDSMEPNTGGTNPTNTVTTNNNNLGQQQIEPTQTLEGYTIITDEEFADLLKSIEGQRKRD